MSSFTGKTVLITGGASGIGLLTARKTIARGASKIILWDIDKEGLPAAKKQLDIPGVEIICQPVDITRQKNIIQTAKLLIDQNSLPHFIFNNAGIVKGEDFVEQSYDDIHQTIAVNTLGMMYVTRAFLPAMCERQSGHIINISSAASLTPNPGMAVYAASKWAATGWSESLKLELEKRQTGIKVLTVMPSYIDTGMFKGVKAPRLMPLLSPDHITEKMMRAVEKNKARLREPFLVKLTPFIRGILPAPIYDFVAGALFRVYSSMDTFTGRNKEQS